MGSASVPPPDGNRNSLGTPDSASGSKNDTKKITAIVIPVVVVGVILLAGVFFSVRKCRARKISQSPDEPVGMPELNGSSTQPKQDSVDYSSHPWGLQSELEGQQHYIQADSEMPGEGLAQGR